MYKRQVGENRLLLKHLNESVFVNGVEVTAVYSENAEFLKEEMCIRDR